MTNEREFEQLFIAHRMAVNDRLAAWATIHRKARATAIGNPCAEKPSQGDVEALIDARVKLATVEDQLTAFLQGRLGFDIPSQHAGSYSSDLDRDR